MAPHGIPPTSIVGGIAIVSVTFNIDPNQSTDENLGRLAQFVNNLSGNTIPQLENHIETFRDKVKEVHAHAAELSAQTLEHMQEQIDGLQGAA